LITYLHQDLELNNRIALEAICLRGKLDAVELDPAVEDMTDLVLSIRGSTDYMDIGILQDDRSSGSRVVRFKPKDENGNYRSLDKKNPYLLAYCYPVLFSKGEKGYSKETKDSGISIPAYISSIYLHCENLKKRSFLYPENVFLPTNRLQALSRVGQVIIVDLK
jgi:hypothetical protein